MSQPIKVIICGMANVGKTAIINRYIYDTFNTCHRSTIGATYFNKQLLHDGKTITVNIWDTMSAERYNSLQPLFFKNATIALVVYDVSHIGSFNYALQMIEQLRDQLPDVIITLVGNKIDLDKQISTENLKHTANEKNVHYEESSAYQNIGIVELFEYVDKQVILAYRKQKPLSKSIIRLDDGTNRDCCF